MARTKIKFINSCGEVEIGYAELDSNTESVWVFHNREDEFGFTIFKSEIIKIYKR